MASKFRFPFTFYQRPPFKKNPNLLQTIVVISSSILSSSAIATVIKAWLDNKTTRLTIHVNGDRKTLEYKGHHLNRDVATIQTILDKLSKTSPVAPSLDAVTIDLAYDEQKKQYILESGSHHESEQPIVQEQPTAQEQPIVQEQPTTQEQPITQEQPSRLKWFLPHWLHRWRAASNTRTSA